MEIEKLQSEVLHRCHTRIINKLNLSQIIPLLDERNLLTIDDTFYLKSESKSPAERVSYLINILPTKKYGWWNGLIESLKNSSKGTAHNELAEYLEEELLHDLKDDAEANIDGDTRETSREHYATVAPLSGNRERRQSVHTASKITEEICAFGSNPYMFSKKSNVEESFKVKKFKKELDEVKYKYQVMVNQVKLIQLLELLIDKSTEFSVALSGVLELYVIHFKSRKEEKLLLSESEGKIIQIIKTVTECTETINMDEEKGKWDQCLTQMRKQLVYHKEILYSTDTHEMAKLQKKLSLRDEEEKAYSWIDERKKVIEASKSCLIDLKKICDGEEASSTFKNICQAVQNRTMVGESCLKAWIDWVEHRANLLK